MFKGEDNRGMRINKTKKKDNEEIGGRIIRRDEEADR